jgi:hypothetical protein
MNIFTAKPDDQKKATQRVAFLKATPLRIEGLVPT